MTPELADVSSMTAPREGTVRTRHGLRLFYRDYAGAANRTSVLCLPGLSRNSKDFCELAGRIAPARRVITPDQRGRGRSEHDSVWMRYNPAVYVDDMWQLLDELQLDRVIVIGTSLGGLMAMLMAALRPSRLAGVVLNDIGPELDSRGLTRIRESCGRQPAVRTWQEAVAQVRAASESMLPGLTSEQWLEQARHIYREDATGVPVLEIDPRIGDAVRVTPTDTANLMWMAFASLQSIPTLLLRGEHSDLLSAATAERMCAVKPDLRFVTIPNRGHVPLLNEAPAVTAIDTFLAQLL